MSSRFEQLLEESHPEHVKDVTISNKTDNLINEWLGKALRGYGDFKNAARKLNQDLKNDGLSGVMSNSKYSDDESAMIDKEWKRLSKAERDHWDSIAADPGKTDPVKGMLGRSRQPTGYELFTQYYLERQRKRINKQAGVAQQ